MHPARTVHSDPRAVMLAIAVSTLVLVGWIGGLVITF